MRLGEINKAITTTEKEPHSTESLMYYRLKRSIVFEIGGVKEGLTMIKKIEEEFTKQGNRFQIGITCFQIAKGNIILGNDKEGRDYLQTAFYVLIGEELHSSYTIDVITEFGR